MATNARGRESVHRTRGPGTRCSKRTAAPRGPDGLVSGMTFHMAYLTSEDDFYLKQLIIISSGKEVFHNS